MLLARGHSISYVVSQKKPIQDWCSEHKIICLGSIEEFLFEKKSVDYIFSIVNGKILSQEHLSCARFGAINYHDAPLPKYAGVNATTWAILNGEQTHGVTWHKIAIGIDEGDIVYQAPFSIDPDDTAFTLNLRCFEAAIKGFSVILDQIEGSDGILIGTTQNLANRSYFSPKHLLPNLGFIHWESANARTLERMCRALNFGGYSNNVGTLKLYLGVSYLVITEIEVCAAMVSSSPGTIIDLDPSGLCVSTQDSQIRLRRLVSPVDGTLVSMDRLVDLYKLKVGDILPAIDIDFEKIITDSYQTALGNDQYWLSQLSKEVEAHNTFHDRILARADKISQLSSCTFDISLVQKDDFVCNVIASIYVYLMRVNHYKNFRIFLNHSACSPLSKLLFVEFLPLAISILPDMAHAEVKEKIQQALVAFEKKNSCLNDIVVRHPLLQSMAWEGRISISVSKSPSLPPDTEALLHFDVNPEQGVLTIYHRVDVNAQGGILKPLLLNMNEHISNIFDRIANEPKAKLNSYSFLSEYEQRNILGWSVGKYRALPANTLVTLFDARVRCMPDAIAVYERSENLTYHMLYERSQKVCAFLQSLSLPKNSIITIHTSLFSSDVLVACLGILRANHICNFLDVAQPQSDGQIRRIFFDGITYSLSHIYSGKLDDDEHFPVFFVAADVACEGIMLSHKQIINYALWYAQKFSITTLSVCEVVQEGELANCVLSCFPALLLGASIVLESFAGAPMASCHMMHRFEFKQALPNSL
ncbi:MAG: putative Methionyl-tRNA formyltransferase [Gammaproteobacteria bacterium]|nr:putative Methionyl-tRNA formyltransferase [Gammaproteobacteria bacterium]